MRRRPKRNIYPCYRLGYCPCMDAQLERDVLVKPILPTYSNDEFSEIIIEEI